MQRVNLIDHVTGSWIPEILISITYEDTGNPLVLTGATVRICFQHLDISAEVREMSNLPDEGLTISNAAGGVVSINSQSIDWEPGTYEYQVWVEFATAPKHVYLSGQWKITKSRKVND